VLAWLVSRDYGDGVANHRRARWSRTSRGLRGLGLQDRGAPRNRLPREVGQLGRAAPPVRTRETCGAIRPARRRGGPHDLPHSLSAQHCGHLVNDKTPTLSVPVQPGAQGRTGSMPVRVIHAPAPPLNGHSADPPLRSAAARGAALYAPPERIKATTVVNSRFCTSATRKRPFTGK
jgi:hypothetical protein